jgi:DegV family protein with EDD domain
MEKFIKNGHPEKIEKLDKSDDLSLEYSSEVQTNQLEHNITFRYCTESLIEGENIDTELIKEKIKGMGDSLVVAGTNKKLKVHIHTNQPADVFYNLNKYGNIIEEKVDDMKMQYEISKNKSNKIALVTDSLCDLPQEFIDKYHIHRVPLSVHFGKTHFLDRVTITPSQFYQMIDESPIYPTSSQPSVRTFQNLYSFLASHYESIIAIHLTDKMSGTWNSSKMASEKISNKKITVINSKEIASSLAMIVWKAAKEISAGKSHDEVVKSIEETMPKTHLFVSVKTLKYMTKSGRITPLKSKIANFFNLKPVILVDDNGNSKLCKDLAFSDKENLKKILKMIENYHKKQGIEAYGVSHAGNLKEAKEFSERIKNTIGISSEFTMDLSPVTGMHVGKGVIAVGIILK